MTLPLTLQVGAASQSEGFAVLHVYVCAALLVRWSAELQALEFQDLVMFLQANHVHILCIGIRVCACV